MTVVAFSMAGEPRGQGRPRATARGGFASVYKDPKSRKYEQSVAAVARAAMGERAPLEGPLSLSLRFRMPIPKSYSKGVRASMASGETAPVSKPDLSNLVKAIEDGMNTIVFVDDSQIVRSFQTKIYAEQPGVDVRVEAYQPQGGEG
jgi:Holliday junction resolvase RusA-like endonuclease